MDELELAVDKGRLNEAIPLLGIKVLLEVVQQPRKDRRWRRNVGCSLEGGIRRPDPVLLFPELATPLVTATHAVQENGMDAQEQVER